jgi:hypothetical protein
MLALAWEFMTAEQRHRFREHPNILALVEAAGELPLPPDRRSDEGN